MGACINEEPLRVFVGHGEVPKLLEPPPPPGLRAQTQPGLKVRPQASALGSLEAQYPKYLKFHSDRILDQMQSIPYTRQGPPGADSNGSRMTQAHQKFLPRPLGRYKK